MTLRARIPVFTPISLSSTDAIFTTNGPAPISEIFNIPLLARSLRIEDWPELRPYLREPQVPNLSIMSLFADCDVTVCDHNTGPYGWDWQFGKDGRPSSVNDGLVVLARMDRRPLHLVYVQMMLEYVDGEVREAFAEYHLERSRWRKCLDAAEYRDKINEMRGNIEAMVKKPTMKAAWLSFKEANAELCAGVSSPWDE